jgi:hypothetical protein
MLGGGGAALAALAAVVMRAATVCGDANGDGGVTVTDGVVVLRAAAGLASACTVDACDVDGNGAVTVTDGVLTLRAAAGLPNACGTQPAIAVDDLRTGDGVVRGHVTNVEPRATFVVGWARTDRWYVQPRRDAAFTPIADDGTWEYATNPWEQVAVLLVDRTYVVPEGPSIDRHPSGDRGVLAFAEAPTSTTVAFSGSPWHVKATEPFAVEPGPCAFSRENVRVDGAGRAHLSMVRRGGRWTCAELVHEHALGYGAYTFRVDGPVDALPVPSVLGLFVFESLMRELDVELSRFLAGPQNAQFVVQPFTTAGNRVTFEMPPSARSTHRILWRPDRVVFTSWNGWDSFPPKPEDVVATFTYTGPHVPPAGNERVRMNLWLPGEATGDGPDVEAVIASFAHDPNAVD